jgi:hypothetical protein
MELILRELEGQNEREKEERKGKGENEGRMERKVKGK